MSVHGAVRSRERGVRGLEVICSTVIVRTWKVLPGDGFANALRNGTSSLRVYLCAGSGMYADNMNDVKQL